MKILLRILCAILSLSVIVGCEITPQQELAMGRQQRGQLEQQMGGVYPDPQVQQYVQSVGTKLAVYANRPEMDWQFRVLNSSDINALAMPGGYIYITRGLLVRMHNESEMAGVLGHEAAHIKHRDTARQMARAQQASILTGVAGVAGAAAGVGGVGAAAGMASQLALLSYSRDQERAADIAGLSIMTQAGYNPDGLREAMQIIKNSSQGGKTPSFLSTHPDPGDRLKYIQEEINKKYLAAVQTGRVGQPEFQANVLSRMPAPAKPAKSP